MRVWRGRDTSEIDTMTSKLSDGMCFIFKSPCDIELICDNTDTNSMLSYYV